MSAVLSEFARTLATDFSIDSILDHLVERIVHVLPISAAGVTLREPSPSPGQIAASHDSALRFEQLQNELGEGPGLAAYHSRSPVAIPDLSEADGFPLFIPVALAAGLRAAFAFPLYGGDRCLGALDLYRNSPGMLDLDDIAAARTLADVAAAYLLNAQARDTARATSDDFRRSATHDPLTGLANRLLLQERLEHAGQRVDRSRSHTAVLVVDIDRFKQVNTSYGHQTGDRLLVAVAERLAPLVRRCDTLARFSGDEFVLLCEDIQDPADTEALARRIYAAFSRPFVVNGNTLEITASIGSAAVGPDEGVTEQLLTHADIAMYQVKERGGAGYQVFDLATAQLVTERLTLERDLRGALNSGALDLAFQPIVRVVDGRVSGVEALLRWTSSERGPVSPLAMVAAAEQSGLITEVGGWVLERACQEHAGWLAAHGGAQLDMSVNISARQLMTPGFSEEVAATLHRTEMDPAALVLEITESVLVTDPAHAILVLGELKRLGVRIALDDFGTGYSSLSYLRQLPIDIVKIDQSFIADMRHAREGGAIIEGVTTLAHALGLLVIAEGVETIDQHERVASLGCDSAQGYFYARPMPAREVGAALSGELTRPWQLPNAGQQRPFRHFDIGA
jgi:diguanylate cyclase (GGDEF)-like protein